MNKLIERPGISSGWERYWRRIVKNLVETVPENGGKNVQDLKHFAAHGFVAVPPEYATPVQVVKPPRAQWETSSFYGALARYGQELELQFELGLTKDRPDYDLALRSFAAVYLWKMTELEIHRLFPTRMGGRTLQALEPHDFAYTALGLVLGCEPQASDLVRAQLGAYRKGYFSGEMYFPIYVFILRVLADYMEDSTIEIVGEALHEPIFLKLFELWRNPDPEQLIDVCLAALDYHTHRCRHGNPKNFYEFERGNWTRLPIEIWLIFKLRGRLGLVNPMLEHPMMIGACGVVPPDFGFKADPLISAVYARMKQEGFDEEAICVGLASDS